jgi:REP element-mobilizing transposase RayT
MENPLVITYHLIWTAYGWWLPNDPRGSGSRAVASDLIAELGELHLGRKTVQPPASTVRAFYQKAAAVLKYPLLSFTAEDRTEIAQAFAEVIDGERYTCYGCAIMPDHVHILIRKHKHTAEQMIQNLQHFSRLRLSTSGKRSPDHPTWTGGGGWKVFLDHLDELRRTITYIRKNPLPLGLPEQSWLFVREYNGWPLHPGHSPKSPYAVRLRQAGRYPHDK